MGAGEVMRGVEDMKQTLRRMNAISESRDQKKSVNSVVHLKAQSREITKPYGESNVVWIVQCEEMVHDEEWDDGWGGFNRGSEHWVSRRSKKWDK